MVGYVLASSRFLRLRKSSTFATKAFDLSGGDQHAPANAHGLQLSKSGQPMKGSFAKSQNFHCVVSREHAQQTFITCRCPDGGHVFSSKPYISVQRRAKDYTAPRCFFRQPTGQNRPFNCRERLFRLGLRKNAKRRSAMGLLWKRSARCRRSLALLL